VATPRQFARGVAYLNSLIDLDGRPAMLCPPPAGKLPRGVNGTRPARRGGRASSMTTGARRARIAGLWPAPGSGRQASNPMTA